MFDDIKKEKFHEPFLKFDDRKLEPEENAEKKEPAPADDLRRRQQSTRRRGCFVDGWSARTGMCVRACVCVRARVRVRV